VRDGFGSLLSQGVFVVGNDMKAPKHIRSYSVSLIAVRCCGVIVNA